jgi:hypothetical protein
MQNIVATFDDPEAAKQALARLQDAGIPADRIRFDPAVDTEFLAHAGPSQPSPGEPGYRHQGVLESIGGFFANLLESHTDESGIYSEALRRGTSLLTVRAEGDEAERVVALLQDCGAVNLEDRVGRWRAEGWAPGGGASAGHGGAGAGSVAASSAGVHSASPTTTDSVASPARAGTADAAATMRGGPVGTHSFTGGGTAVGMPSGAASGVGGASVVPDGTDIADTGSDPTLPSSQTAPTALESGRLRERAVAASERGGAGAQDVLNRDREPGANR